MTAYSWTGWHTYKLSNRIKECRGAASFYFAPADGSELPDFRAGQIVALRTESIAPTPYILCGTPNGRFLRLTVKCTNDDNEPLGPMTAQLMKMQIGDTIEVSAPTGDFVLEGGETPVVVITDGIGVTAAIAFLSELSTDQPLRPVHVLVSTLNGDTFPLREEALRLVESLPNGGLGVFYKAPKDDEHAGRDYTVEGGITVAKIRSACMDPEADYYLCGPKCFTEDIRAGLVSLSTRESHIHVMSL